MKLQEREYLRPAEVYELYGIKPVTVRAWLSQGRITGISSPRLILINHADFRDRLKKVESGEPWDVVFEPVAFGRRRIERKVPA